MKKCIYVIMLYAFLFISTVTARTVPTGVGQSDFDTEEGQKLNLQIRALIFVRDLKV